MPAPIISGLITIIGNGLNVSVWDGEVPRYDSSGNPINPDSTVLPTDWPAVKVSMNEQGFTRDWTTEDPYTDTGEILIQVWSTTREDVEAAMTNLELLLAQASNWANIQIGGDVRNPNYVIQLLLVRWTAVQEEGELTSKSEYLYRADMHYECMIHGAIPTT